MKGYNLHSSVGRSIYGSVVILVSWSEDIVSEEEEREDETGKQPKIFFRSNIFTTVVL